MSVACFIRSVEAIENQGSNTYRITINCNLMDATNSTFQVAFDAIKGSDWRIQARQAAAAFALSSLGETVDFVVTPGLETL